MFPQSSERVELTIKQKPRARGVLKEGIPSMSCIHLHLGQAGNQIGKTFWGLAEEEFLDNECGEGGDTFPPPSRLSTLRLLRPGGEAMFHEDSFARCLAVDSEPKVVRSFRQQVISLRPENAIISQNGLANNWAMGFASCRSDGGEDRDGTEGGLFDRCMEGMRKEAERSCWLNSIVMTHSLAGGTGSGLGSGLLQALRDEYPSLYLISTCVGPFRIGDTPLQHYNSALALQHLQAFSDAVIYRGNDDLLRGAKTAMTGGASASRSKLAGFRENTVHSDSGLLSSGISASLARRTRQVSTADMNASLSLDMGSYFFPTSRSVHLDCFTPRGARPPPPFQTQKTNGTSRRRSEYEGGLVPRAFDGGSLMAAACPLPAAKFVDLRSSLSGGEASCHLSVDVAATREWVSVVEKFVKAAPICPRKDSARADDVCIAAHHVVRGAVPGTVAGESSDSWRSGGRGTPRRREGDGKEARGSAAMVAASAVAEASSAVGESLRKHHQCPEWRTATNISCSPALRCREVARSITTVCNQTRIRAVFRDVLTRAEEKFNVGAYLHWYYRHGLEDEDFLTAFDAVRTMEQGYEALTRSFDRGDGGRGHR